VTARRSDATSPLELLKGTTPGPWEAQTCDVDLDTRRVFTAGVLGADGLYCVLALGEGEEEAAANAKLAAAAPDLARRLAEAEEMIEAARHLFERALTPTTQPAGSLRWNEWAKTWLKNHPRAESVLAGGKA
jgi:hypothetical protein